MKQDFVILPREVSERALASLESEFGKHSKSASDIRAALEQPQNHVPDAGNMVPAGWKLVPVEPNCSMVLAGERSLEQHDFLRLDSAYRAMLDAAPKPPTVKDSLTDEQPRGDGWPEVARLLKTVKYLLGIAERGTGRKVRDGETVEQFVLGYVKSLEQPRKPLTDDELDKLCPQFEDPMRREMWKLGFKVAHNIKD